MMNKVTVTLFLSNFEKLLSNISKHNPFLSVITGDFNARSSSWWSKDIDTTEGSKLFSLTSSNGFPQLINEPTDIQTSNSSCTDLTFTNQPNLRVNSGVHASLHPNCHLHIIHFSFNLNISSPLAPPPPPGSWERLFDQKDINVQAVALNESILNIFLT